MRTERKRLLADGLIAGFIGYGVVVASFLAWNVAAGLPPFHTAALMGAALFGGLRDPALLVIEPGMVIAFNGVHLAAFLGFGFVAAWLVYETEQHPQFWYLAFFLFLVMAVAGFAVVLATSLVVGSLLPPWEVVLASMASAIGMATYLVGSHRGLVRLIRTAPERLGTVD